MNYSDTVTLGAIAMPKDGDEFEYTPPTTRDAWRGSVNTGAGGSFSYTPSASPAVKSPLPPVPPATSSSTPKPSGNTLETQDKTVMISDETEPKGETASEDNAKSGMSSKLLPIAIGLGVIYFLFLRKNK